MIEKYCCGIYDFDGVYVAGEELMDEYIMDFCRKATNKYCEELFHKQSELIKSQQQLEADRNIYGKEMREIIRELEEIERLLREHFNLKDQVLEETEEKYRNKINYKEIYQRKNVYPGVLDIMWKIYEAKVFYLLISNTHVNAEKEIIAKRELLQSDFPPIKFVPVRYHIDPYRDQYGLLTKNRKPSDKVGILLRAVPTVDANKSILVDNSKSIITRGTELGLRSYFVEKNEDAFITENPTLNPIPSQVILQSANDTIDMVHGGKIKKLSL